MDMSKDDAVGRAELLYDPTVLRQMRDRYGHAEGIKHHVDTPALIYEIRTALRYWFGGKNNHRTNDNIWDRCGAVDEGNLALDGDELVYEDEVMP